MPSAAHTTVIALAGTPPHVEFTVQTSGLQVSVDCSGSYGTSTPIVLSSWDFGDGASATGVTPSHTYASAGTYTITYTATQQDGQTAQTSASVTVSVPAQSYDWSDSNLPWTYSTTRLYEQLAVRLHHCQYPNRQ